MSEQEDRGDNQGGRFGRTPYKPEDLKDEYGTTESGRLDVTCPQCFRHWGPSSKCCVNRYAGDPFCPHCGADFRASTLDFEPEWPVGVGAVLYGPDPSEDRRDLWHVTTRYEDADGSDRLLELWDGTHTKWRYVGAEDLLADYTPAGWTWPTGRKPLYHLTRSCGVDDDADLMTDGGREQETDAIAHWTQNIHQGDAVETLAEMPESSVHCAVTSPPYFGQRDYGAEGQIGLEDSVGEFIDELLAVAEEVRRVLREDGSWWLNLGDTFAGSGNGRSMNADETKESQPAEGRPAPSASSFPRKSKLLVPHRVAIALQDAGWLVRMDNVWAKTDPIPNPVKDRHTETKEYVFHLTPAPDYWFDLDAVRVDPKDESLERAPREYDGSKQTNTDRYPERDNESQLHNSDRPIHPNGKNPGDIWEFSTCNFPDAHFAVFPRDLPERAIKASCPPRVCTACGTPYERDVEEVPVWERDRSEIDRDQLQIALDRFEESDLTEEHLKAARAKGFSDAAHGKQQSGAGRNTDRVEKLAEEAKDVLGGYFREMTMTARETGGWSQGCDCQTGQTEPGIVLDPFAGAGTTPLVAKDLGRRFIGTELNPDYVAMAQHRVGVTVDEPERLDLLEDGETSLAAYADGGATTDGE